MPPHPPPLTDFFSSYPKFKHDPRFALSEEFTRLAYEQGWMPCKKAWKRHHRLFLAALAAESHSAVHKFFIKRHPNFITYHTKPEAPKSEFARLAKQNNWKKSSKRYKKEYGMLMEAYHEDFRGEMNDFFMSFEDEEQEERGETEKIGWIHNPWACPPWEWNRLAEAKEWKVLSPEYRKKQVAYYVAIEEDFNNTFGWNEKDGEGWKFLCETLNIAVPVYNRNMPEELKSEKFSTACKEAMANKYVNIYDVLDSVRACGYIKFFPTEKDLSDYSYEWDKVFPMRIANHGAAQFLLRKIAQYEGMVDEGKYETKKKRAEVKALEAEQSKGAIAAEKAESLKLKGVGAVDVNDLTEKMSTLGV